MLKGFAINRNAVSEQKYEDLKKAVGLLENVFSKELLLTSDQATDLFDVIRDYTYALDTLDAYDYQRLKIADTTAPERFHATYENAIEAIQRLKEKFGGSNLFGVEKDASPRRIKSHLRRFSRCPDADDSREPSRRDGHDGEGCRLLNQSKELIRPNQR